METITVTRKRLAIIAPIIVAAVAGLFFALYRSADRPGSDRPVLCAGIPPIAEIVRRISGSDFEVVSVLPAGKNPHDYSPGTAQIRALAQADLFFCAGLPFEERLESAVAPDRLVEVGAGITLRRLESGVEDTDDEHHHHHGAGDPHLWLSPDNLLKISANIAAALIAKYPSCAAQITGNLTRFQQQVQALKAEISELIPQVKGQNFYVYHPAFGYYTDALGMKQIAIEVGGREPSPKQLAAVVKTMRDSQARVLFVQSNFSPRSGAALRAQTGARVVEIDPMSADPIALMKKINAELMQK